MSKTDLDNTLTSSNKTKNFEVQKQKQENKDSKKNKQTNKQKQPLNSLLTEDYSFSLVGVYFTSNDVGSQNIFVYQPKLDALELKKDKSIDYVLIWTSKGALSS